MVRFGGARKRQTLTVGAANRRFSRRKLSWEVPFNTSCQKFFVAAGQTCPNGGNIQLMTNQHLRANHEDGCAVVAIKGNLFFQPYDASDPSPLLSTVLQANQTHYMRIGLRKDQVSEALAGVPISYNPLLSGTLPDDEGDFTEGRWLWLREHMWEPQFNLGIAGDIPKKVWTPYWTDCEGLTDHACVIGPVIATGGESDGLTVDGVPGFKLGGEFVCPPQCDPDQVLATNGTSWGNRYWRLRVNIRRRITLRENDSLNFWFGWENLQDPQGSGRKAQYSMQLWGGIRLLIEK